VRLAHAFLVAADLPIPGDAFLYRLLAAELVDGSGYSRNGGMAGNVLLAFGDQE